MLRKIISLILCFSLFLTHAGLAEVGQTLNLSNYLKPGPNALRPLGFQPPVLRYFSYDTTGDNFQLLLDPQDLKDKLSEDQTKSLAQEQLNYFLVGLTLPNSKFWVNLRPDAPDNIIEPELEQTEVGRIMLESDLQLKKDTANFTSPQTKEGRVYWDKLYAKAKELFGSEPANIPTITRPWIVPGEILIREDHGAAYVYKATLKVMLEEDYLKSSQLSAVGSQQYTFKDSRMKELNVYSSQLIRELILPKLTQEVNSGKNYASLRQVYFSLVLSRWFKMRFASQRTDNRQPKTEQANLIRLIDTGDLTDLTSKTPWSKTTYFKEYQKSFAQGEYNLKETVFTPTGQVIRSYVSGGVNVNAEGNGGKLRLLSEKGASIGKYVLLTLFVGTIILGSLIFLGKGSNKEIKIQQLSTSTEFVKMIQGVGLTYEVVMNWMQEVKKKQEIITTEKGFSVVMDILNSEYYDSSKLSAMIREGENAYTVLLLRHYDEGKWIELVSFNKDGTIEILKGFFSLSPGLQLQIVKTIQQIVSKDKDFSGSSPLTLKQAKEEFKTIVKKWKERLPDLPELPSFPSELVNQWNRDMDNVSKLNYNVKYAEHEIFKNMEIRYNSKEPLFTSPAELGQFIKEDILGPMVTLQYDQTVKDKKSVVKYTGSYSMEKILAESLSRQEKLKTNLEQLVARIEKENKQGSSSPADARDVTSLSIEKQEVVGGIDFTDIEKYLQFDGSLKGIDLSLPLLSKKELESLDLEKEEQTLRNYLTTGFNPNGDRLKRLLAGLFQKDQFTSRQLDLLRLSQNLCNFLSARGMETTPDQRAFILIANTGLFLRQGQGKASIKPSLN